MLLWVSSLLLESHLPSALASLDFSLILHKFLLEPALNLWEDVKFMPNYDFGCWMISCIGRLYHIIVNNIIYIFIFGICR